MTTEMHTLADPATEAVARVLYEASEWQADGAPNWPELSAEDRKPYLDLARSAIDVYEAAKFPDGPVQALVNAMSQLLDDMGPASHGVCGLAKAQAVAAYEPWRQEDDTNIMSLAEAERIIDECDYKRADHPLSGPSKAAPAIAALPLEEMP